MTPIDISTLHPGMLFRAKHSARFILVTGTDSPSRPGMRYPQMEKVGRRIKGSMDAFDYFHSPGIETLMYMKRVA